MAWDMRGCLSAFGGEKSCYGVVDYILGRVAFEEDNGEWSGTSRQERSLVSLVELPYRRRESFSFFFFIFPILDMLGRYCYTLRYPVQIYGYSYRIRYSYYTLKQGKHNVQSWFI